MKLYIILFQLWFHLLNESNSVFDRYFSPISFSIQGSVVKVKLSVNIVQSLFEIGYFFPKI